MFKIGIFDKKIGILTDCRLVAFARVLVPNMPIEDPYKSKFFSFSFFPLEISAKNASCGLQFWPQPTNSDSGELFRMKLFVYIDG